MVGLDLTRQSVYFGHPFHFWKQRQRLENMPVVDVDAAKTLADVAGYDALHTQKALINRTSEKVQELLNTEEFKLWQRREKLRLLLQTEKEELAKDLVMKQAMRECSYCKNTEDKQKSYEEDIEKEKVRECLKALEREKIGKGMPSGKIEQIRLKALQKAQMEEKRRIEMEEENIERLWHQVLLDDVRRKEQFDRDQAHRRHTEMLQRRLAYDEQISSANRKRREMLQAEREKENKRLERMRRKMAQDHYEALRRKKEQQMTNKINFTEGHQAKLQRLETEKLKERQIDDNTITTALRELEEENRRKREEVHKLQMDKKDCIANFNRDRRIARELEDDRDNVIVQWMREKENNTEERLRSVVEEKRAQKKKMVEQYRTHVTDRNLSMERERRERATRMQEVKRTAVEELQKKLDSANEELRRQLDYRNNLNSQIMENRKAHVTELMEEQTKQRPFTKKAIMFKDAMDRVGRDPGRKSTNPVHPFKRVLESEKTKTQLPSI